MRYATLFSPSKPMRRCDMPAACLGMSHSAVSCLPSISHIHFWQKKNCAKCGVALIIIHCKQRQPFVSYSRSLCAYFPRMSKRSRTHILNVPAVPRGQSPRGPGTSLDTFITVSLFSSVPLFSPSYIRAHLRPCEMGLMALHLTVTKAFPQDEQSV